MLCLDKIHSYQSQSMLIKITLTRTGDKKNENSNEIADEESSTRQQGSQATRTLLDLQVSHE